MAVEMGLAPTSLNPPKQFLLQASQVGACQPPNEFVCDHAFCVSAILCWERGVTGQGSELGLVQDSLLEVKALWEPFP